MCAFVVVVIVMFFNFCFFSFSFSFFSDISPNIYVIEAVGFSDLSMILVNLWKTWKTGTTKK